MARKLSKEDSDRLDREEHDDPIEDPWETYQAGRRQAAQAERRLAKAEHAERMGRPRTYRSDRLGKSVTIPED